MIPYGIGERKGKSRKAAHPDQLMSDGVTVQVGPSQLGTFGPFARPEVVGVSDDVAYATKQLVRSARRAEKRWTRTLPKGVTV